MGLSYLSSTHIKHLVSFSTKEAEGVGGDEEGAAHVGEDGEPKAGDAHEGEEEDDGFEAQGDDHVLFDDGHGLSGVVNEPGESGEVIGHKGNVCSLYGGVGTCGTHSDGHISTGQCWRIVHPITDHGNSLVFILGQGRDDVQFILGEEFAVPGGEGEHACDSTCSAFVVASEHNQFIDTRSF